MLKRATPLLFNLFNSTKQPVFLQFSKRNASLYEPPYLEGMKPKYPTYDVINVKITGYDYPILESYQRFVHRIAESLDFDVSECWAHPPKKTRVVRYKPNSSNIESEYNLTKYERYIQISDILAPIYPVFLRFVQSGLPEGVTLSVVHHTDFIEESRYVPDKELLDLKAQLEAAGGPITKGRK
ncbi:large ribosomal subunit protein mL48 [Chironomus tepperi]|uniref:large ribosomal subunit protein mL48 n=1 Tax=Chironomus tepperi TaxID=113505 RepID=UPI00391EF1D6